MAAYIIQSMPYKNNMILNGATYILAFKLSSHATQVGWPDLTEFDFRPRLTSESTA